MKLHMEAPYLFLKKLFVIEGLLSYHDPAFDLIPILFGVGTSVAKKLFFF